MFYVVKPYANFYTAVAVESSGPKASGNHTATVPEIFLTLHGSLFTLYPDKSSWRLSSPPFGLLCLPSNQTAGGPAPMVVWLSFSPRVDTIHDKTLSPPIAFLL